MADSRICTSCGYVIDERLHPVADIGEVPVAQSLGEKPTCPVCGASEEAFRPCACAPAPLMHPSHLAELADTVAISGLVLRKIVQRGLTAMKQLVVSQRERRAASSQRQ